MAKTTFINIIKIILITVSYTVLIISKAMLLYLAIRVRLSVKRAIYTWRFKSRLKKHKVPSDLRKHLEHAYSKHLKLNLRVPGFRDALRFIRREWRK